MVLVHRPRYDDWTLPKGKAADDESDEDCALREVEEETGVRCELLFELPTVGYRDLRGRKKRVRYWAMRPFDDELTPRLEVDEARWVPAEEAQQAVTYERDRVVLRACGYVGARPLLLLRHARAGKRKEWKGDDEARPLDERGREQARRLVQVLAGHEVEHLYSSPYLRCLQTLEPLAADRAIPFESREELAEGAGAGALLGLVPTSGAAVLCVHGDVLEELFGEQPPKGSTTLVDRAGGKLRRVTTIPPP